MKPRAEESKQEAEYVLPSSNYDSHTVIEGQELGDYILNFERIIQIFEGSFEASVSS
jgi:hypothetical protein